MTPGMRVERGQPGSLLAVPAFWRPTVRGETRRPQVEARELLAGFTEPMRKAQAERAQGRLDL